MRRSAVVLGFLFVMFGAMPVGVAATSVHEVVSTGGVRAWLLEDPASPVIAVHLAFRGGVEQDTQDKQGLAYLTTSLLTQGAGDDNAEAFQKKLANHSVALHFAAGRDMISGSMKFLREDRAAAVALLRASLHTPRFDSDAITRMKAEQLAAVRAQFGDPAWQARVALFQSLYAGHPYGYRSLGSAATLAAITQQDVRDFARHHFARDNLVVAVAGNLSAGELAVLLDEVFGGLPERATLQPVPDSVWPEVAPQVLVERDGTQTTMLFAVLGVKRDDPDWYALEIANYILGGGGFASRLMRHVREERGLTYGIGTMLLPMQYGGIMMGQAATGQDRAGEAWRLTHEILADFYHKGVTDAEVAEAKKYLVGSMPLTLTSTDKIAAALVAMQMDHLGADYIRTYAERINSVPLDSINRAIRRCFNPDRVALVAVGQPEGMDFVASRAMVRE